jgi:hypothetical protein
MYPNPRRSHEADQYERENEERMGQLHNRITNLKNVRVGPRTRHATTATAFAAAAAAAAGTRHYRRVCMLRRPARVLAAARAAGRRTGAAASAR